MHIEARVCGPEPKFLYIINRKMLKNDSNAYFDHVGAFLSE